MRTAQSGWWCRQEGLKALWTGSTPNIARNAIVNAAELATYDQIKHSLINTGLFQVAGWLADEGGARGGGQAEGRGRGVRGHATDEGAAGGRQDGR